MPVCKLCGDAMVLHPYVPNTISCLLVRGIGKRRPPTIRARIYMCERCDLTPIEGRREL